VTDTKFEAKLLFDLIKKIDKSVFERQGVQPVKVSDILDKETFVLYLVSCVLWGPVGFQKKCHNDKSIRECAKVSHNQFRLICAEIKVFLLAECKDLCLNRKLWPE